MEQDVHIIQLLNDRDARAIPALEQAYGPLCRVILNNILNDRADVEECLQDLWLAVWHAIPPENPSPLRPWLCRVARNLALKRYHQNTAQKRDGRYDATLEELAAILPDSQTVEDELAARELTALLNRFLTQLDKESRILFLRRYWYGDSVETLAKAQSLRPNTVTVRLSRLRSKLKAFLEQEGYTL